MAKNTTTDKTQLSPLKRKVYEVIFEAETPAGKAFDLGLMGLIVLAVIVTMLETLPKIHANYYYYFYYIELFITFVFSVEYVLRIWCLAKPKQYIFSTFGIIDLLSILPTYLSLFVAGTQYISVLRLLRLLRMFRILKLTQYIKESKLLLLSIKNSSRKIMVFFLFLLISVCVLGSVMFAIESPSNPGFRSIPESIYWAIVTITTVGYGDISPITPLGKVVASLIMILGYSIITVPTGIVGVEMLSANRKEKHTKVCQHCLSEGHDIEAKYCKDCGTELH
ncbi:MAG: ion transporter [Candidatus Paceibacterota bacterium]